MAEVDPQSGASRQGAGESSALAPFHYRAFAVLWVATVVANIGTWMQNAAAGWLMTSIDPDPFAVSLVQVAASLPMFLFALPAGALADIVDRRRLLIFIQVVVTVLVAAFGFAVWLDRVSIGLLLTFSFLAAAAAALIMPAWQAVVPELVPRGQLQPAVALNSVGLNVSRAVGPALAGVLIAAAGMAAPFWVNALTTLGVIAALVWWRPPDATAARRLPKERFTRALAAGLRHARHNPHLRATLIRAAGFFPFASAYWALLPLVARNQLAGGPELYGLLLGAIGTGAVASAFTLPWLKRLLGPDRLVAAGASGTALAMLLFAVAKEPVMALAASLTAGISWIAVLATINVSGQVALPPWVRGRGLSIFATVMFGALTLGSFGWGKVAALSSLSTALLLAALGCIIAVPLFWRWKLQTGAGFDLTPSMHWPEPVLSAEVQAERGPVLVTVEYQIGPDDSGPFLAALSKLSGERRRDGAFDWDVFEDLAEPGRFVETFMLDSWSEHMRQHARITHADRALQERVNRFQVSGVPKVSHLIAAELT